ncbi:hypothetical protein HanIR_Chr05g0227921 [Helianthus annuus]|nr:hypothetical protein HanIR_Chr05g0227921 [Helianthus annuus]
MFVSDNFVMKGILMYPLSVVGVFKHLCAKLGSILVLVLQTGSVETLWG